MERRIANIIICGLVALMTAGTSLYQTAGAQEYVAPPVTISKDKVKIDGKVFYSHIVLEKQTLFSISKAYNVSIEDIYRYNPAVQELGLRKNDILNIPVVEATPQKLPQTEVEVTVQQPEEETQAIEGSIKHIVKWYEDLASISKKYNVSEEILIRTNKLPNAKVRNKQVLIIPTVQEAQVEMQEHADSTENEWNQEEELPTILEESTDLEQYNDTLFVMDYWDQFQKHTAKVTLILPFKANGTSSNRNNMDLYCGLLLAAKELEREGNDLQLRVYDIANGIEGIPSDELKESDVIIGPITPDDIEKIATLVNGACPIVSPLDHRAEKLTSKYRKLIQAPSSQFAQFSDIAQWIDYERGTDDKVIVISEKEARQNDAGRVLRSIIDRADIRYTPFSYSILEGRSIQSSLEAAMTKTGTNRVVIASESEAFVNDAVRNLNLIAHKKINVVLYAPAKIRTFETIEVENFHNTSLHGSLSYYIDYHECKEVKDFIMKYRAVFGAEPTQFAFQGYDLMKYFTSMIVEYPEDWMSYISEEEGRANGLQSRFEFQQNGNGGYINNGVKRIEYQKDYSIVEWTTTPLPEETSHLQ